jgi:hypothetical protein
VPKNSKAPKGTKVAKAKKKCCKDKPRRYTVDKTVPKKAMLIARQR